MKLRIKGSFTPHMNARSKDAQHSDAQHSELYHTTKSKYLVSILTNGLKVNSQEWGILDPGSEEIYRAYGFKPIFLAIGRPWNSEEDDVVLKVDASELNIVADIPRLIDYLPVSEGEHSLDWEDYAESSDVPFWSRSMRVYFEEGVGLPVSELLDPNSQLCKDALRLTHTGVSLEDIPASKIVKV